MSDRETKARFPKEAHVPERLNEKFKQQGLLFRVNSDILSIGPPLCITKDEVDEIIHGIDLSLWGLESDLGVAQLP